jgi:hypothetical protein
MVLTHLDHIYLLFNNISRATFKVNMDITRGDDVKYDHYFISIKVEVFDSLPQKSY